MAEAARSAAMKRRWRARVADWWGVADVVEHGGGEPLVGEERGLPVADEGGEEVSGEEEGGAEFDEGVADGDVGFAVGAAGLEEEVGEDGDVLVPVDGGVADGAVGGGPVEGEGAAFVEEEDLVAVVGEAPDDDVEEGADGGAQGEEDEGEGAGWWVHVVGLSGRGVGMQNSKRDELKACLVAGYCVIRYLCNCTIMGRKARVRRRPVGHGCNRRMDWRRRLQLVEMRALREGLNPSGQQLTTRHNRRCCIGAGGGFTCSTKTSKLIQL